jgi:hypothetical protein
MRFTRTVKTAPLQMAAAVEKIRQGCQCSRIRSEICRPVLTEV